MYVLRRPKDASEKNNILRDYCSLMDSASSGYAVKVLCDGMLGSLVRWLRILGLDAEYFGSAGSDRELLDLAKAEGRVVLTRDKGIIDMKSDVPVYYISSTDLNDQIKNSLSLMEIKFDKTKLLTRCLVCNTLLVPADLTEAATKVPERILTGKKELKMCPSCKRFYWWGTHCDNIIAYLKQIGVYNG